MNLHLTTFLGLVIWFLFCMLSYVMASSNPFIPSGFLTINVWVYFILYNIFYSWQTSFSKDDFVYNRCGWNCQGQSLLSARHLAVIWTCKPFKATHQDTQIFLFGISKKVNQIFESFSLGETLWDYLAFFSLSKCMFKIIIIISCDLSWNIGNTQLV